MPDAAPVTAATLSVPAMTHPSRQARVELSTAWSSIQRALDALFALPLVFLESLALGLELLVEHTGHGREQPAIRPPGGIPEPGAPERLGTVEEALLDLHADGEKGLLAPRGQPGQDVFVAHDGGAAVHAQRLLPARDQEDQTHVGIREDVAHAIEPLVARPVGDDQPILVQDVHEARLIALGRDIALARGIRGRQQQEWRERDEPAARLVQRGALLLDRPLARRAQQRAQLVFPGHHVLEHVVALLTASTRPARPAPK